MYIRLVAMRILSNLLLIAKYKFKLKGTSPTSSSHIGYDLDGDKENEVGVISVKSPLTTKNEETHQDYLPTMPQLDGSCRQMTCICCDHMSSSLVPSCSTHSYHPVEHKWSGLHCWWNNAHIANGNREDSFKSVGLRFEVAWAFLWFLHENKPTIFEPKLATKNISSPCRRHFG
jgi:hypothetical protein